MNITVEWISPKQETVLWTVDRQWTYDDFETALKVTRVMLADRAPETVNLLVDMRRTYIVPANAVSAVVRNQRTDGESCVAPNHGYAVVVSEVPLVRKMVEMLAAIPTVQRRLRWALQMEDAAMLLRQSPSVN